MGTAVSRPPALCTLLALTLARSVDALHPPWLPTRQWTGAQADLQMAKSVTPVAHRVGVSLSPWVVLRGVLTCSSWHEFTVHLRDVYGDVMKIELWPVLPPIYLMMGKAANRGVFSEFDSSLGQILQELINVLPVSARIPKEEDVQLQKRVATLFQSGTVVDELLPSFRMSAKSLGEKWMCPQDPCRPLMVFFELSEYVLRADLKLLYGQTFSDRYYDLILPRFTQWVKNIANGQLIGFFDDLGGCLRQEIADRQAHPDLYEDDRSVMQVYLASGALDRHAVDDVVGLLSMTLMAAVFNTQISLAWILVHLYSDAELLRRARSEIASCRNADAYVELAGLSFLNSCIDESVRLHTMLPGNTVIRRALRNVDFDGVHIPRGSILWLYPNAVHQDANYFEQPSTFCPMRFLKSGELERMSTEFELVTFGYGAKRCIGEKMARAMIIAFLVEVLPALDADVPTPLPADDNLFDLIPASKLELRNVKRTSPNDSSDSEITATLATSSVKPTPRQGKS